MKKTAILMLILAFSVLAMNLYAVYILRHGVDPYSVLDTFILRFAPRLLF